jgi:8-oxo-dGTP pyrophosphatase MutT (NUDIX family)
MITRTETSAGGVAFRASAPADGHGFDVVIIRTHEGRWQLPKGWIEDGEPAEATAVREVREEAGIDAEIVAPLGTVEYWFRSTYDPEPARVHKFVHVFLLRYLGGSTADHDDEVTEARWVSIGEALHLLSHRDERDMVERAKALLEQAAEPA